MTHPAAPKKVSFAIASAFYLNLSSFLKPKTQRAALDKTQLALNCFLVIFVDVCACRKLFCFGILTLVASQTFLVRLRAQTNNCSTEDSARRNQIQPKDESETKIVVEVVEFHGDNPLSETQQSKLTEQIQQLPLSKTSADSDGDWPEYAAQSVRNELQAAGYFRVLVEPIPFLIRADKYELHYALRFDIESGPQYRLGNVSFKNNEGTPLSFSESLLRQQLQLKTGDLLDVQNIREALGGITGLYTSKGYIDMVPTTNSAFKEDGSRIDLTVNIDEGSPYRIGSIEIVKPGPYLDEPPLPQSQGDIFSRRLWSKFFDDGTLKLISRNSADHSLELSLDFRSCRGADPPETAQSGLAKRGVPMLKTVREH